MDLVTNRGLASAVGWQGIELARATIGAVAVSKLVGAYTPFDRRHAFASPFNSNVFRFMFKRAILADCQPTGNEHKAASNQVSLNIEGLPPLQDDWRSAP